MINPTAPAIVPAKHGPYDDATFFRHSAEARISLEVAVDFFARIAFANLDALYLAPKSDRTVVIGDDEFP